MKPSAVKDLCNPLANALQLHHKTFCMRCFHTPSNIGHFSLGRLSMMKL